MVDIFSSKGFKLQAIELDFLDKMHRISDMNSIKENFVHSIQKEKMKGKKDTYLTLS